MKVVEYTDPMGRRWRRGIPDDAHEAEAVRGVPMGPPSLANLGLPHATEVRLNNELANRGIWTADDLRRVGHPTLQSALMAALKLDVQVLTQLYQGAGSDVEEI